MSKDNEQQDLVKAAARRMCEHLGNKGVQVKHAQMLEALSVGLGVANWRTLRAALDAPRATHEPAKPKAPPPGVMQEWAVDGIYDDNDQQWSDNVLARTALQAVAMAKMERMTDCCIIDVIYVRDSDGNVALSPSFYKQELQFDSPHRALRRVLKAGQKVRGKSTKKQQAALAWLQTCLRGLSDEDDLDELTDVQALEEAQQRRERATFTQYGETFRASEALEWICDLLEEAAGGVVAFEEADEELALMSHQVRAMAFYFSELLDDEECGLAPLES